MCFSWFCRAGRNDDEASTRFHSFSNPNFALGDAIAAAGKRQVIAVEDVKADGIELVIVSAGEAFAALVVLPNPRFEPLLDFFLTFAGG